MPQIIDQYAYQLGRVEQAAKNAAGDIEHLLRFEPMPAKLKKSLAKIAAELLAVASEEVP